MSGGAGLVDTDGRWWCRACFAKKMRDSRQAKPAADGAIGLEKSAVAGRTRAPCPTCGGALIVGQPVCGGCGYDPRSIPLDPAKAEAILGDFDPDITPEEKREKKKPKPPPPPPKEKTCTQCGYALTGVPARPQGGIVCPECGEENRSRTRGENDEQLSREVARWTYLKPALMAGISLPIYAVLLLIQGWWQGGWQAALVGPVRAAGVRGWPLAMKSLGLGLGLYVWSVGIAFVVTVVMGVMWTGISTTFRVTAVTVAGLLAVAFACGLFLFAIPLPLPWWAIFAFCMFGYTWYVGEMLDLDMHEAFIVSLMTAVGIWASAVGLMLMM